MSEMLASEAATAPACPPVAPPRVVQYFRCKCGAVEIELAGEPFLVNNCHCTMCIKVAHYLDAKGGGISSIAHTTGVAKAMFFLENVSYMKGKALLRPLKIGPEGKNVRSYTELLQHAVQCRWWRGQPAVRLPAVQSERDRQRRRHAVRAAGRVEYARRDEPEAARRA